MRAQVNVHGRWRWRRLAPVPGRGAPLQAVPPSSHLPSVLDAIGKGHCQCTTGCDANGCCAPPTWRALRTAGSSVVSWRWARGQCVLLTGRAMLVPGTSEVGNREDRGECAYQQQSSEMHRKCGGHTGAERRKVIKFSNIKRSNYFYFQCRSDCFSLH